VSVSVVVWMLTSAVAPRVPDPAEPEQGRRERWCVTDCALYCSDCEVDCLEACDEACIEGDCDHACQRICADRCLACQPFCTAELRCRPAPPSTAHGS
jgi:hypothetical protein